VVRHRVQVVDWCGCAFLLLVIHQPGRQVEPLEREVDKVVDEEDEEPVEETSGQKRKRAPASKTSKPASRAKRNKPSSSKKQVAEPIEEGDEE